MTFRPHRENTIPMLKETINIEYQARLLWIWIVSIFKILCRNSFIALSTVFTNKLSFFHSFLDMAIHLPEVNQAELHLAGDATPELEMRAVEPSKIFLN